MSQSDQTTADLRMKVLPARGGFIAIALDLFGCMGDGATPNEAEADCRKAALEWLDEAKRLGRYQS